MKETEDKCSLIMAFVGGLLQSNDTQVDWKILSTGVAFKKYSSKIKTSEIQNRCQNWFLSSHF